MIKIEDILTYGWETAIRGMRNPKNSWNKSDSLFTTEAIWNCYCQKFCSSKSEDCSEDNVCANTVFGENDATLMIQLANAGPDHRKFMRMVNITMDITAPLYWWKEYDTYKVGTVANSCSSMHNIEKKEFTMDDFSHEKLLTVGASEICIGDWIPKNVLKHIIMVLNKQRELYLKTKDKIYWWQMIQLLPSSYNQKRTIQMNYEAFRNMYHARKNHKLDEWQEFCGHILSQLPCPELIIGEK